MLEDIGGGVDIIKVKAHTTWWDVLAGKVTARNRAGNHLADQEAKHALREAKREAPAGGFNAQLARAVLWTRWVLRYADSFVKDTSVDPEQADLARAQEVVGAGAGRRERGTMTHERWRMGVEVSCRRCGREDTEAGGHRRSLDDACVGSAGGGRWHTRRGT